MSPAFAIVIVLLEVFMRYASYVSVLRWLTLSLFAYVATVFVVGVPWGTVAFNLVVPHVEWTAAYFTIVVAIFGTTISPYLFFWQASEEVEEVKEDPAAKPILKRQIKAPRQLQRIRLDTMVGMGAVQCDRAFHRADDRCDPPRAWRDQRRDLGGRREGAEADCG